MSSCLQLLVGSTLRGSRPCGRRAAAPSTGDLDCMPVRPSGSREVAESWAPSMTSMRQPSPRSLRWRTNSTPFSGPEDMSAAAGVGKARALHVVTEKGIHFLVISAALWVQVGAARRGRACGRGTARRSRQPGKRGGRSRRGEATEEAAGGSRRWVAERRKRGLRIRSGETGGGLRKNALATSFSGRREYPLLKKLYTISV